MTDLANRPKPDTGAGADPDGPDPGPDPERTGTDAVEPVTICAADAVGLDRGVAALLPCGTPIAVFRLAPIEAEGSDEWFAVDHVDPATGAPIMARGLVGSADVDGETVPTVASPLHKQRYDLRTGRCLDDPSLQLCCYELTIIDEAVHVRS